MPSDDLALSCTLRSALGALETPPLNDPIQYYRDRGDQEDMSLERWFTATERYAPQLREVEHDAYVTMKRREYLRQQMPP